MAVESPNRPTISPLRFFNRTARVNQEGISVSKQKLIQIDSSFKNILSVKDRSIDVSRIEDEETERQEREKKLESRKFFVRGVGRLSSVIPGKNTIQKFLLFMAFAWLFNTFSKYFGELGGPLSKIIMGSAYVIDAFSKIAFGIFDGFATFVDIGYKTWDVIKGTEDSQKLQSALNNVLLDIDSFFGGILSLLGIVEQPPPQQQVEPGMMPGTSGTSGASSGPGGAPPPSSGNLPRAPKPGQAAPAPTPQAPPSQVTGGIIPSKAIITSTYGSQESFRSKPHTGIDYGYDVGTPISLVKSGVVVEASSAYNAGYGNFILIQHSNGTYSMFNHLDQIYVKKGQKINATTGNAPVIGTIGDSGFSTGPHLDFKVATKWDGYNPSGFIDPRSYQDSVFRIGGDVTVKPSQIQKLAKKNGKEGVMIDGQWTAKSWSKAEKERYTAVSGQQEQSNVQGNVSASGDEKLAAFVASMEASSPENAADALQVMLNRASSGYSKQGLPGVLSGYDQFSPISAAIFGKSADPAAASKYGPIAEKLPGSTAQEKFEYLRKVAAEPDGLNKLEKIFNGGSSSVASKILVDPKYLEASRQNVKGALNFYGAQSAQGSGDVKVRPGGNWFWNFTGNIGTLSSKPTLLPTSKSKTQDKDIAAQEYAASKGKYYSSTTKKTYGSYSEALKDPEVKKATAKPERWAIDPRGWFGMKGGGIVQDIPKQTKSTDVSSLSSYPSYSQGSTTVAIQPVYIKVPTPTGKDKSSTFPVPVSVNNSMGNLSNLSQG